MIAIIASGPSAKKADLKPLRGRAKVIAIKENVDLCPWADMVYGCDSAWWKHRRGLPTFSGIKVSFDGNRLPDFQDLRYVKIAPCKVQKYSHDLQFQEIGTVGSGGNSGFQALNLALQLARWAPKAIVLIGFDMTDRSGVHWYGRNRWPGANNPDYSQFRRWIAAYEGAANVLRGLGIQVFNTSLNSALRCFPFAELEAATGFSGECVDRIRSA